ncbi:MAG: GspE/PulE family protein [Verrucomicrobiota bacterium JB022]|nr:GspE/PulE family protein [Verrucomicrobiota bacterium JB022]
MLQDPNPHLLDLLSSGEFRLMLDDIQPLLAKHGGPTLGFLEDLIESGVISKERAARLWGDSIHVAYVNPLMAIVTTEATERLPKEICEKAAVLPLYMIEGVLTVAMADPRDQRMQQRIASIAGVPISAVFGLPREIQDAINLYYLSQDTVQSAIAAFERKQTNEIEKLSEDDLKRFADSNLLSQILDELILFAIRERASDIHFEATEDQARIRFRIDGKLIHIYTYNRAVHRAFAIRLKVLCKLDIAESRFPQDGRFSMPLGMGKADFRLSFCPTVHGPKIVLRILAGVGRTRLMTLDEMMVSRNVLDPFRRLVQSPNGIIFVTGPTGSGKTTTLYSALQEINTADLNISTIEDPVEVQMAGLTQTQVNSQIDLKFSTLLRSMLRQDPDVLLVGEIRDLETAKIACEAALTGHLVLSTLHTNNAIQAVTRLIEIGIEPYMVAPSMLGVLAQRLAARICEKCKEPYYPSRNQLERYFKDIPDDREVPFYHGRGCNHCRQSGLRGRIAFHELLVVTNELRSLINRSASEAEMLVAARKAGYRSLRYDGLKKVLLGLTTIEEIEAQSVVEWED